MKGPIAVLGAYRGKRVAGLIENGQLEDLLVESPDDVPVPGSIYRAVADRPLKGQGGVIVQLAGGQKGYLRKLKGIAPGQVLLVQVTGYAEAGKAVPVTDQILFKSRYVIVTPGKSGRNISRSIQDDDLRDTLLELAHDVELPQSAGLIVRSAAAHAAPEAIADDIAETAALATQIMAEPLSGGPELLLDGPDPHVLAWRDWDGVVAVEDGPDAVEQSGLADLIDSAFHDIILPSGGSLFVEETRAMVTVDVNTGTDTSLAAGLKANLAVARALPRALRVRGLGGQIVVDFAPCPKKDRRQVEQALGRAFRADLIDTTLAGWTPLGHFELQRKRERMPLSRSLP